MSSQSDKLKHLECSLVREFLKYMGIPFESDSIESDQDSVSPGGSHFSGPDVKVTCTLDGEPTRIGIELTTYQNDAANGSTGRKFKSFFDQIWDHLKPLLECEHELCSCLGYLVFDPGSLRNRSKPKMIAEQLRDFLQSHLAALQDDKWHSYSRTVRGVFRDFPMLHKHFEKIHLAKGYKLARPHRWHPDNTADARVVEDIVIRLIEAIDL